MRWRRRALRVAEIVAVPGAWGAAYRALPPLAAWLTYQVAQRAADTARRPGPQSIAHLKENIMKILRASAVLLGLSAVVLVLGAGRVAAQRGAGRGQGPAHYDVAAEMTATGTVDGVRQVTEPGPWTGTHVTLKTATGTLELALGPSRFMTQRKYSLAKGDQVEVIGAKAQFAGRDVLIVREIKKGSDTMTFRDAKGLPKWSGRAGR
jgi:hypothetical protein